MRIISRKMLRGFYHQHPDAKAPLDAWFREARKGEWTSPLDVKVLHGTASILKNNRVIFNIGGNKYRLVVWINYRKKIIYIRYVGTHREYDKINAEEI
ncbi:MAG TPA: type II toxin-antitoxin system HigB family toxin [Acidobacteriota bacterium]|nr:type II toxin-antitoxin system HigB family toxin [Acidobacteriota bacterium]